MTRVLSLVVMVLFGLGSVGWSATDLGHRCFDFSPFFDDRMRLWLVLLTPDDDPNPRVQLQGFWDGPPEYEMVASGGAFFSEKDQVWKVGLHAANHHPIAFGGHDTCTFQAELDEDTLTGPWRVECVAEGVFRVKEPLFTITVTNCAEAMPSASMMSPPNTHGLIGNW